MLFDKTHFFRDVLMIAEVGQNHQGNIDLALEYIDTFSRAGANVIKFQTRNNKYLLSEESYNAPYASENAFAPVYGQHREKLELPIEALPILKARCHETGVKFMSTAFDEPSLDVLKNVDVDLVKVASFDLGNLPFLKRVAALKKPIVLSIGGGRVDQIQASVELLQDENADFSVLHCVSEYPCEYNRLGLSTIPDLIEAFPTTVIGLSDHFNGTLSGPVAYMQGARVFEKHVTLNRAWKGTDHSFALEPDGFRKLVRDTRRVADMLPRKSDADLGNEPVFKKLGKSVTAYNKISKGSIITINDLSGRIFQGSYIPVRESAKVIGSKAMRDIEVGQPIQYSDIETPE